MDVRHQIATLHWTILHPFLQWVLPRLGATHRLFELSGEWFLHAQAFEVRRELLLELLEMFEEIVLGDGRPRVPFMDEDDAVLQPGTDPGDVRHVHVCAWGYPHLDETFPLHRRNHRFK